MKTIRKEFYARGRVQGVGFRFYIAQLASRHRLTGFAENLTDGSVRIQLQGDALSIEQAKEAILMGNRWIVVESLSEDEISTKDETKFSILG